jgi:hypothetical protein
MDELPFAVQYSYSGYSFLTCYILSGAVLYAVELSRGLPRGSSCYGGNTGWSHVSCCMLVHNIFWKKKMPMIKEQKKVYIF